MPYSLKGRNVLITGGSRGLGAVIAQRFAAEGSNVAINYASSKETADKVASELAAQYNVKTITVQGDAGSQSDCTNVVKTTIEQLGGIDVVISNAGWTKMTKFSDLDAMDDADWDKCWSINVKSNFHLFKAALPTFNANPDGGVFILTSSTAGVTPSGSSIPYAVTKSASIHLMKCLAQSQGPKVRVNAVCPGLLLTEWGKRFSPEQIKGWEDRTALGHTPEVEDTADAYLSIARNSSMTGQAVQVGMSIDS
ncbi:Granaticin polyketide synthase putative ketoacyl reductase 2 [Penicillium subrubescens]|uniref:Granaticin polyketide synthase putative ketoacyl reductase 2 n=1 Tax=Penicillium subrubescens TaxID=1316194 RepID=A0A1Q5T121_9EURO|nr:Granaticin polyketide synthase putative ketoacyl reductase 2 [Penicillium subrubescens]